MPEATESKTPTITSEWIDAKRYVLFRRDGNKWAYARSHGDGKRWDVMDRLFAKVMEIPAAHKEAAIESVMRMALDGSLQKAMQGRVDSLSDTNARVAAMLGKIG